MRQILKNLLSLSVSEIFGKIIGVITAVYIARVLKPDGFGIINFAYAFVSYFPLVSGFGLDTYGNREVAIRPGEREILVNNIFSLRMLLSGISYLVLGGIVFATGNSAVVRGVLLLIGLKLFSDAANINWYFQAVEKMKFPAMRRVISGLLSLGGIIMFVKTPDDIITAAGVFVASGGISSIIMLVVYGTFVRRIKFSFDSQLWKRILRESFPLLVSTFMIAVYYNLDMIMLGYMKTQTDVGIYSAAYKIFLVGIIPLTLIVNSFFPAISRNGLKNSGEFRSLLKNYFIFLGGAGVFAACILFFMKDFLVIKIFGVIYSEAVFPLAILAVNALVISMNMFFGNPLIAWGKQKQYSLVVTCGAVSNVLLNFIFIPAYSFNGAALATLFSEVIVFGGVVFLFKKYTGNIL